MTQIKAHYDGKVIVPDEPVDLPLGCPLIVHVETPPPSRRKGQSVLDWIVENGIDDPAIPSDLSDERGHRICGATRKGSRP